MYDVYNSTSANTAQIEKPKSLAVQHESIPHELKADAAWVGWRYGRVNETWTKIPINLMTGQKASTTDQASWASFDIAKAAPADLSGIGWCLHDRHVGIDLDHCRDPESGEIESWAREIIDRINSYSEISPSGTGIRIICKGVMPPGRKRTGKDHPHHIEIYDSARYLTVTGHHIDGTPTSVLERSSEIAGLHVDLFAPEPPKAAAVQSPTTSAEDREIIGLASEHNDKFAALWRGEWESLGYDSQSSADLALCDYLAFYVGNGDGAEDRIKNLFSQSGLTRDKWERPDYSSGTIQKAMDRDEFFNWEGHRQRQRDIEAFNNWNPDGVFSEMPVESVQMVQPQTVSAKPKKKSRDFIDANEVLNWPDPKWWIENILVEKSFGMIYGSPGCFKTFVALDMALSLAHGLPFLSEFKTARKIPVGYIVPEGSAGIKKRLRSWMTDRAIERLENIAINKHAFGLTEQDEAIEAFSAIIKSPIMPEIIFIDTLARNFGGGDENSTRDMNRFVNHVMELAEKLGIAVIVIHHAGKNIGQGARGSSALNGAVDLSMYVDKLSDDRAIIKCTKQKDAAQFPNAAIDVVKVGESMVVRFAEWMSEKDLKAELAKEDQGAEDLALLKHLEQPRTKNELVTLTGWNRTKVFRSLDRLITLGKVVKTEKADFGNVGRKAVLYVGSFVQSVEQNELCSNS